MCLFPNFLCQINPQPICSENIKMLGIYYKIQRETEGKHKTQERQLKSDESLNHSLHLDLVNSFDLKLFG